MRLLAACSPGEIRVAAWDGSLVDYAIWRPGRPDGVGDLHRGRVVALMPAMAGAFVAIEGGDGFLPDSEWSNAAEGVILGVRVTRAAQGGKGPRLTARLSHEEMAIATAGPVGLLRRGAGAVERFARAWPTAPITIDDAGIAAQLRPRLGNRLHIGPAFDDDVASAVEALSEPVAALPGGARMSVHPTPALTAIDIDLASASAGHGGKAAQHAAVNRALLPALARQIRLRNLAGAILVDLAGLSPKRRAAFGPALTAALAGDPLQPRFLGFSALGLAEILRPRVHPPLHEMLAGAHAAGLRALRELTADNAARPHDTPSLLATPAIVAALRQDQTALDDLAHRTGRPLNLTADPNVPPPGWCIVA